MVKLGVKDVIGERSLPGVLRRIQKLHQKRMQANFSDSDHRFEEWMALRLLAEGLVETAGDLARELGIATGATTRLIDSLENQGFIERDSKQNDRRVVLLKLTKSGEAQFRNKLPDMLGCWNELFKDWKRDEVDQLVTLLMKLQAAFARNVSEKV